MYTSSARAPAASPAEAVTSSEATSNEYVGRWQVGVRWQVASGQEALPFTTAISVAAALAFLCGHAVHRAALSQAPAATL